jgi:hypothetical protein
MGRLANVQSEPLNTNIMERDSYGGSSNRLNLGNAVQGQVMPLIRANKHCLRSKHSPRCHASGAARAGVLRECKAQEIIA